MPIRKSQTQAAAKFGRGISGAGQNYSDGVNSAQSWQARSLASAQRRNVGLQAAIASGAIDAGIQRAGDAKWKSNTIAKGVPAFTGSAQRAQAAYAQGLNRLYPMLQAGQAAIQGMDNSTLEARLARMAAHARAVHQAKTSGGH